MTSEKVPYLFIVCSKNVLAVTAILNIVSNTRIKSPEIVPCLTTVTTMF